MNKRISLYLCYAAITLFAMVLTINSPLLSDISETLHLSLAQSGVLFTANFAGFVCFIMIGGILADRISKKTVLSVAIGGLAVSMLMFPLASDIYTACAIMVLIGGFGGIIESILNAVVAELYPEKAVFYINMTQVFFGIGALLGPLTAGMAVSSGIPWQMCYYVLGILLLFLAAAFIANKFPLSPQGEKITWKGFLNLISDSRFLLICICMFLYTGSEVGGWGWLSTFLKKNLDFSSLSSSMAVGIFWSAVTLGRFLFSYLTGKFSIRQLVIALSFASAAVTFLLGISSNPYSIWILIFLMGFAYSGIWPLIVAYGDSRYDKTKGTIFALLIGSGGVGAATIPLLLGMIAQNTNIHFAIISPALLLLIVGIIFLRFDRN